MNLVAEDENGGFSFIWTIKNLSFCNPQGGSIESPDFVAKTAGGMRWCLRLFPKGSYEAGSMTFFLCLMSNPKKSSFTVNYALSIGVANGSFKKIRDKEFNSNGSTYQGFSCFLTLHELSKNRTLIEDDILTLRCRIWKKNRDLKTFVRCFAKTKISIEDIVFVWTLKDFKNLPNETKSRMVQSMASEITPFSINLLSGGTFGDSPTIEAVIKQVDTIKRNFLRCQIGLLDINKIVVYSVSVEHWFDNFSGTQVWKFPFIPKKKLFDNDEEYMSYGSLCLSCKFSVSSGNVVLSEVEGTEYRMDKYSIIDISDQKISEYLSITLNGCLKRLYC